MQTQARLSSGAARGQARPAAQAKPAQSRSLVQNALQLQQQAGNAAVNRILASAEHQREAGVAPWRASNELWYFGGESAAGVHPTRVTLHAGSQARGEFNWSVTDGSKRVDLIDGSKHGSQLTRVDDNRIDVVSREASHGDDDVRIRATRVTPDGRSSSVYEGALGVRTPASTAFVRKSTVAAYPEETYTGDEERQEDTVSGGQEESPEQQTGELEPGQARFTSDLLPTAAPKSLRHISTKHSADATWGYSSYITYEVRDDKGKAMKGFDVNEKWTTGVVNDAKKTDWRRGSEGAFTSTTTQFSDHIGGEAAGHTPTPQAPHKKLQYNAVQHWGQDWYIGSLTIGKGTRVQANTLQKYQDHAEHTHVKSPP